MEIKVTIIQDQKQSVSREFSSFEDAAEWFESTVNPSYVVKNGILPPDTHFEPGDVIIHHPEPTQFPSPPKKNSWWRKLWNNVTEVIPSE